MLASVTDTRTISHELSPSPSLHLQIIAFILTEHFSPSPVTGRHVSPKANSSHCSLLHSPFSSRKHLARRSHPQTLSDSFPKALNKQTSRVHEASVSAFLALLFILFSFSGFLVLWSQSLSASLLSVFSSLTVPWNHLQYVPRDCDSA